MPYQPDPQCDFPVTVVPYMNGHDPHQVRVENGLTPIDNDLVLLHSIRPLGLKHYPIPCRYDPSFGSTRQKVAMFAYNGVPSVGTLEKSYPTVPWPVLNQAVLDIWANRLS